MRGETARRVKPLRLPSVSWLVRPSVPVPARRVKPLRLSRERQNYTSTQGAGAHRVEKLKLEQLSASDQHMLRERNRHDLRLYNLARNIFEARLKAFGVSRAGCFRRKRRLRTAPADGVGSRRGMAAPQRNATANESWDRLEAALDESDD